MRIHITLPIALYIAVAPPVAGCDQYDPRPLVDINCALAQHKFRAASPETIADDRAYVPAAKLVEMRYGSADAF